MKQSEARKAQMRAYSRRRSAEKRATKSSEYAEYNQQWLRENPRNVLVNRARSRANKQGVPFDLTVAGLYWPTHCPVLGLALRYERGTGVVKGGRPESASLDRIDPTKGYVPSNVRVISWRANKLKADATLCELEKLVAYVRQETMVALSETPVEPLKTQ